MRDLQGELALVSTLISDGNSYYGDTNLMTIENRLFIIAYLCAFDSSIALEERGCKG